MNIGAREPGLRKHEILRLMRIAKQNHQKHHTHQARVKHLADIRRHQQIADKQMEYDRLYGARIKGPLGAAAERRLSELKAYVANAQ